MRKERGEAAMHAEKRVIRKGKAPDSETANTRDEGRMGKNIIHDTSTTTMRPTCEMLRTRETGEAVQDHQIRGLT